MKILNFGALLLPKFHLLENQRCFINTVHYSAYSSQNHGTRRAFHNENVPSSLWRAYQPISLSPPVSPPLFRAAEGHPENVVFFWVWLAFLSPLVPGDLRTRGTQRYGLMSKIAGSCPASCKTKNTEGELSFRNAYFQDTPYYDVWEVCISVSDSKKEGTSGCCNRKSFSPSQKSLFHQNLTCLPNFGTETLIDWSIHKDFCIFCSDLITQSSYLSTDESIQMSHLPCRRRSVL